MTLLIITINEVLLILKLLQVARNNTILIERNRRKENHFEDLSMGGVLILRVP
jgi:hypothetical protein